VDIHLGVSQILQNADPMYLADIAIERNRQDHTGAALRRLREEHGLRQTDINGLSERQVRRIEDGISRLRVETAEKFATAFGMDLSPLLDQVGRYAGEIRRGSVTPREGVPRKTKNARATEAAIG
jgi:transcriptional regulator with XRE-family HTH domain